MERRRPNLCIVIALAIFTLSAATAFAVTKRQPLKSKADEKAAADALAAANDKTAPQLGPPQTIQFRVGAEVTAKNGACRGIIATVSVPLDCPEQSVRLVSEDFSPDVAEVAYRPVPGGEVRQMMISIPRLNDGVTAHAILTLEVSTRTVLPPEETAELTIPKKIPANIRAYMNASPYIEANHQRIKAFNKEVAEGLDESANDWAKIEAIYDAVLEKIAYVEGPDKGAVETLRDGQADCQGRSAVFIALCRANKIPARMVWVHGHCYPEFYLEKAEGQGHWYPSESAGTRAFGEMPLARTILQKGDNFRVPERKEKLRYASDYLTGLPTPGGGKPKVKYIREIVPGSGGAAIDVSSNAGF